MEAKNVKRRFAAVLCAAMLFTHSMPAWAEGIDPIAPQEAQAEQSAPVVSQMGLKMAYSEEILCVTVTGASQLPVVVTLMDEDGNVVGSQTVAQGMGTVYFPDLASGTYKAKAVYADEAAQAQISAASATETILTQADAEKLAAEAAAKAEAEKKAAEEAAKAEAEKKAAEEAAKAEAEKKAAEEAAAKAEAEKKAAEEAAAKAAAQQQSADGTQEGVTPEQKPLIEAIGPDQTNGTDGSNPEQNGGANGESAQPPVQIVLGVNASVSGNTVTVELSGNKGENVDVVIYNEETEDEAGMREDVSDTATVTFTDIPAGSYIVNAWYRNGGAYGEAAVTVTAGETGDSGDQNGTDGKGETGGEAPEGDDFVQSGSGSGDQQQGNSVGTGSGSLIEPITPPTVTPPEQTEPPQQPEGQPQQPEGQLPSGKYAIDVTTGKGTLNVTVSDALAQALIVEITKPDGTTQYKTLDAGNGTVSFTGLEAGVYSVYLDYLVPVSGVKEVWQDGIVLTEGADVVPVVTGQFQVDAGVGGSAITVTVTEAKEQAVDVVLIRPDNTTDVRGLSAGNGTIRFENLADGSYSVVVAYRAEVPGTSSVKREGLVVASAPPVAGTIVATASAGTNRVDVSVTAASNLPVAVTLMKNGVIQGTQRIEAGVGSVSFTALAAGTYSVSVDYAPSQANVRPYLIDGLVVVDTVRGIAITGVTGGENKLTITGTAQPNSDVTLTAEPAIPTAIVRAGSDGKFSAVLYCSPGTYTAVYAQYGTDTASRVKAQGTYVVTAPAVRPPITVNPVTEKDSTVIARTNPGTIVNLGTYDYGQTLTADERGMLQYSLPHWYVNGTKITFTVYYGNGKEHSYQYVVTVGQKQSYTLLKKGSRGQVVYDLTARLTELGYLTKAVRSYDDSVVAAVKHFQRNNGLAVDGIAGQLTQTALWSVAAIGAYESGVYPTLVRGDRGLALIYTLQQRLKDLGYYTIRVDGIFGSGTQRAVRDFQAVNGLYVTGKADHTTQVLLYSSAAKPAGSHSASGGYVTLSRSSRYNARVVTLQRRLKALGYLSGSVDGYFGSQTYRAVRSFQQRNGIAVTGVADVHTQQVLYSASAKTYSGSAAGTTAGSGYRLLYWGCKGEDVKTLQKALLAAGYKQVRTADGIYGQWTYDAVCAFQKANGLAVDGVAGKDTQNKLYGTRY